MVCHLIVLWRFREYFHHVNDIFLLRNKTKKLFFNAWEGVGLIHWLQKVNIKDNQDVLMVTWLCNAIL